MTKEFILKEIRRTAEANGGKPLGHQRFFQESGIKQYDWKGKLWARWGDALREAGYSPNELTRPFDDAILLDKLAELIMRLRHFPVAMEMRLQKRSDSSFPNEKVYERFGTKSELRARLIEHCQVRGEFADVITICANTIIVPKKLLESPNVPPVEDGFIYLLKSGRRYKIGRSNAAGRRERELDIQLPEKGVNIHVIRTDDPVGIEKYWHNRFAAKRVRRDAEWFDLNIADIAAFKRRKFM